MNLPEEHPVSIIFPEDGIPWVPASMAIFKNAENMDAAKVFVDWVLSKDGQQFISDLNSTIMVRPDVPKPEVLDSTPIDRLLLEYNKLDSFIRSIKYSLIGGYYRKLFRTFYSLYS